MKWLGEKRVATFALPDFPLWQSDKENDKQLVERLWKVLNDADIVVCHNVKFDLRKSNARLVVHGLSPPSAYKTVDTLLLARRHFAFDSNKLDDLGRYLGCGRKIPHTGNHLWLGCMSGDKSAWATMRKYNAMDVTLLERVYLKLRPWATNHPNLNHFTRKKGCPLCQSLKVVCDGFRHLATGRRQGYLCRGCGHRYYSGPLIK